MIIMEERQTIRTRWPFASSKLRLLEWEADVQGYALVKESDLLHNCGSFLIDFLVTLLVLSNDLVVSNVVFSVVLCTVLV